MNWLKTLFRIALVLILLLAVLALGGVHLKDIFKFGKVKDPGEVYQPLIEKLPKIEMPSPNFDEKDTGLDVNFPKDENDPLNKTTSKTDKDSTEATEAKSSELVTEVSSTIDSTEKATTNSNNTAPISAGRQTTIYLDDKSIDMSRSTTISILDFLAINWGFDVKINFAHVDAEGNSETSSASNISSDKLYDDTLESKEELNQLISSIRVVKKLDAFEDYDRTQYEKPVQSYKLDGNKVNRNDYAWKTSKYFDEKKFTYTCPYTGTVIKDADDGKEDNDYSQLDYDHIVALKSTYLRGAKDWTNEQKNEYAYNQWVGVDVLNSANRSKSDKGPAEYLPDVNVADYCYSWLLICSKYDLAMTQEEIQICKDNIEIALDNGDTVLHMGGHYE